jgi:hypothetical protein
LRSASVKKVGMGWRGSGVRGVAGDGGSEEVQIERGMKGRVGEKDR